MSNIHTAITTRREVLRLIGAAVASVGALRASPLLAGQDALPHLTDANPAAASLGYTEDASAVDTAKFPKHKAGDRCANCRYFQTAASGTQYGPCQLYPGNAVNMNGWCTGYLAT
jgi:hypothetical protein